MFRATAKRKIISPRVAESVLQCAVANYLRPFMNEGVLLFTHSPNEGRRSPAQGRNLKSQGMLPGMPDCDIDIIGGDRFFIELKAKGGVLTENQVNCHALLRVLGFPVYTVMAIDVPDVIAQVRIILNAHGVQT